MMMTISFFHVEAFFPDDTKTVEQKNEFHSLFDMFMQIRDISWYGYNMVPEMFIL